MNPRTLKFKNWVDLNESQDKVADAVKSVIGTDFYVIPDFPSFRSEDRPIEPFTTLFASKNADSFAINYGTNGKLHSIDIWRGENPKPKTIDANGASLEDLLSNVSDDLKEGLLNELKNPDKSDYEYSDPKTIFNDLAIYVDMVIDGDQPALLLTGTTGSGKSKTINQRLDAAGMVKGKDYVIIKGKSTPVAVYIALYENNGKLVIFDDCDSVLKDDDAVLILMGALESEKVREISWKSGKPIKNEEGKNVPQSFDFNGRVIFVSNIPMRRMPDPLKGRAFNLEVAISPTDMLDLITKKMKEIMPEESMGLKKVALSTIKLVAEKNPDVQINFRTFIKAARILKKVSGDLQTAKRLIVQQCSYK